MNDTTLIEPVSDQLIAEARTTNRRMLIISLLAWNRCVA